MGTTSSTEGERKKVISKSKISSRVFLLFLRILLSGLLLLFFFFCSLKVSMAFENRDELERF